MLYRMIEIDRVIETIVLNTTEYVTKNTNKEKCFQLITSEEIKLFLEAP